MKKTIWMSLTLGIVMGILAGLVNIFNLTFMSSTGWPIGFYNIFLFLAAALGGPLGCVSEVIMITMINSLGPPEWREMIGPALYWANVISEGLILLPLFALAYRSIFGRIKMPLRLLAWAGLIAAFYILDVWLLPLLWWLFSGQTIDASFVQNAISGYESWLPQAISDVIITCLLWIALPERYRHPLWYEPKPVISPVTKKA